jgi:AGZA family xanthine/uracil permease-like MFS transporter
MYIRYSTNTSHTDPQSAVIHYSNYTPSRITIDIKGLSYLSKEGEALKGALAYYLVSQSLLNVAPQNKFDMGPKQGWWITPQKQYRFAPERNYMPEIKAELAMPLQYRESSRKGKERCKEVPQSQLFIFDQKWLLMLLLFNLASLLLTFFNVREAIVNCIPATLKKAIGAGIGLYIAFIGLQNAGIVTSGSTLVELSPDWYQGPSGLAMLGLLITAVLVVRKIPGAILIGMIVTTLIGIPLGLTSYAGGSFLPSSPYFFPFAFDEIFSSGKSVFDFVVVLFTFLFVDMFDTVGTLIACAGKSGIIRQDGSIPNCKQALMADAIGTTGGAILGTSTVTSFVESAAGVAAGGRTGLTAVSTAVMFLLALFLGPLFASIPGAATAPALILVGAMMISPVREIDFDDLTEGIPAFLCVLFMVCAYNISDGIMFGILSYVLINVFAGKSRKFTPMAWVICAIFLLRIAVGTFIK